MGSSGLDGHQFGAVDRSHCGAAGVVYLLWNFEQEPHGFILDDCASGWRALWRYVHSCLNPFFSSYSSGKCKYTDGALFLGFMTFSPEWLTANQNLDTSNPMFLWCYLVFFNLLWVFLPLYALYHAFTDMRNAFKVRKEIVAARAQMLQQKKSP